jgi:hypothetical protein
MSREVEVDPVVDVVVAKAIPTLNRLANINVRTSIKDLLPHNLENGLRLRSTYNFRQDRTSTPTSPAIDRVHPPVAGTSLLLVTKTATSLVLERGCPTKDDLATRQTENCPTMGPVELKRDINASLTLCEVHNNRARRSLVSKQRRLFQVSEHPFYPQHHQSQQSDLLLNLKSSTSRAEPKLEPGP